MKQFLDAVRRLHVRRSTIYLCVAWVAIFVLYLAVKPEETAQQQVAVPVVPVAPTPEPTFTYETTYAPTTTTPPTSTEIGQLSETSPSATATTTQVIPLIPNELIPSGLLPAQPTPTPTPTPSPTEPPR